MVVIFCLLLISGILAGQAVDFSGIREGLGLVTSACLAYIMIEVGLEFSADKRKLSGYGWDTLAATAAAVLPALLWFLYFIIVLQSSWQPALLSGLSSAPTSAGVLFAMLMAAGLSATWVFQKARTLAVLDDLVTILLLMPLQIIIHGFEWGSIIAVSLIFFCIIASFRWKNALNWPLNERWILAYAIGLTGVLFLVKRTAHIHLEVLIPAFMLGCLVRHSAHPKPAKSPAFSLDMAIKGAFMLLVGLSFPRIETGVISFWPTLGHVVALTVLANLGKSFLLFCYRKEVPWRERLALSVAMFPRGEVGAAVLLIGLGYGFSGYVTTLAMLGLALNLVLTGVFVWIVIKLLRLN
jgi:Kef-type K+ transport system membrane component KefB